MYLSTASSLPILSSNGFGFPFINLCLFIELVDVHWWFFFVAMQIMVYYTPDFSGFLFTCCQIPRIGGFDECTLSLLSFIFTIFLLLCFDLQMQQRLFWNADRLVSGMTCGQFKYLPNLLNKPLPCLV